MAKKKRVTRKQLLKEPDQFISFSARAILFAADNRRPISLVLGGLLVVALAGGAFLYFSNLSERRAHAMFEQGLVHYFSEISGDKSARFQQTAREKFDQVVKKYPSTAAAQLSLLLYADMSYHEGSYDKAIELYQRALDGFSEASSIRKLIWSGLGYAYEGKKDYKAAAQWFQKITDSEGEFIKGEAYFNLGRMHEVMNDRQSALEAYDKVVKDYPESVNFRIAQEKVLRLKGQG